MARQFEQYLLIPLSLVKIHFALAIALALAASLICASRVNNLPIHVGIRLDCLDRQRFV